MKTDLALLGLRRELLQPDLDARQILTLTEQIVALQAQGPARRSGWLKRQLRRGYEDPLRAIYYST
jgi:hypothetical protein